MPLVAPDRFARHLALPLVVLALAACGDNGSPSSDGAVTLSLATRAGAAGAGMGALVAGEQAFTDGTNTLVLTKVELVLDEFALEEDDGDTGCTGPVVAPDTVPSCARWRSPRRVLDLPLGSEGAVRTFAADVAPGIYHKVGFHVQPVDPEEDDPDAQAFAAANPDFAGLSVRVAGTWNGEPFTYIGRANREFGTWFDQPLVVTEGASADVTIFVDLDRWFRSGEGLVDPRTANAGQPNEALVKRNIEAAFSAFEDDDGDGCDDDPEDDDHLEDDDFGDDHEDDFDEPDDHGEEQG